MGQGSTREAELAGDTLRDLLQGTRSHDCGGLVGKFKPHSAGQETERAAPSHLEVAGTSVAEVVEAAVHNQGSPSSALKAFQPMKSGSLT